MSIEHEIEIKNYTDCNKCNKDMDEGEDCFCSDCFEDLENQLNNARDDILELEHEIEKMKELSDA